MKPAEKKRWAVDGLISSATDALELMECFRSGEKAPHQACACPTCETARELTQAIERAKAVCFR